MIELYEKLKCLRDTETGSMSATLSPPQWYLAQTFIDADHGIVSPDDIAFSIYSDEEDRDGISDQAIAAFVRRLREKIETMDTEFEIIGVRGWGWRLTRPNG